MRGVWGEFLCMCFVLTSNAGEEDERSGKTNRRGQQTRQKRETGTLR